MTQLGDQLKSEHAATLAQAQADYTEIARRGNNPRPEDAARVKEILPILGTPLEQFCLDADAYDRMAEYDELLAIRQTRSPTVQEERQIERAKEHRQGLLDSRRDLFPLPV